MLTLCGQFVFAEEHEKDPDEEEEINEHNIHNFKGDENQSCQNPLKRSRVEDIKVQRNNEKRLNSRRVQ